MEGGDDEWVYSFGWTVPLSTSTSFETVSLKWTFNSDYSPSFIFSSSPCMYSSIEQFGLCVLTATLSLKWNDGVEDVTRSHHRRRLFVKQMSVTNTSETQEQEKKASVWFFSSFFIVSSQKHSAHTSLRGLFYRLNCVFCVIVCFHGDAFITNRGGE